MEQYEGTLQQHKDWNKNWADHKMWKTPVIGNSCQMMQNNSILCTDVSQPHKLKLNPKSGTGPLSPYPSQRRHVTESYLLTSHPCTYDWGWITIHSHHAEDIYSVISISVLITWVWTVMWTRPFIYFRAQNYQTRKMQTISGQPRVSLGNLCHVLITMETREGWHAVISVLQENSPTPPVNKVHKSTNQSQGQVTEDEAVVLHGSSSLLPALRCKSSSSSELLRRSIMETFDFNWHSFLNIFQRKGTRKANKNLHCFKSLTFVSPCVTLQERVQQ